MVIPRSIDRPSPLSHLAFITAPYIQPTTTSAQATSRRAPTIRLHDNKMADGVVDQLLHEQEESARLANEKAEARRVATLRKRQKKKKAETREERAAKARELDDLLAKSEAFSKILLKNTKVLGRVGSGLDGKVLGEHDLKMAEQPELVVGGTMRDYQLEGLTWMMEICLQGMSGILADEMGLGKPSRPVNFICIGSLTISQEKRCKPSP